MTRVVIFYLKQTVMLGTVGFVLWLLYGWWRMGWFWASDTHVVWFFALLLVAAFLLLVCTPVQWLGARLRKHNYAYLLGMLSGPLAVLAFLGTFTHYPVDFTNYISRQWPMHFIFGVLGLWFSFNYQKHIGHNKPLEPTR